MTLPLVPFIFDREYAYFHFFPKNGSKGTLRWIPMEYLDEARLVQSQIVGHLMLVSNDNSIEIYSVGDAASAQRVFADGTRERDGEEGEAEGEGEGEAERSQQSLAVTIGERHE